ncbi:MAG TPA: sel1 repeat family protein [Campylobacteraceae bacterium]|nr:sel1 repeat family protein [Campylobacteraceae bacterium]
MKKSLVALGLTATFLFGANNTHLPELQDISEYQSFLELAKSGDVDAQTMLGEMYLDGINGVAVNHEKAFLWLNKAARKGDPQAQYLIGFMYENGLYVPASVTKAVAWYKKAATKGDVLAQYNLALIYKEGKGGIKKNMKEAFKWLQMVQKEENRIASVAMK